LGTDEGMNLQVGNLSSPESSSKPPRPKLQNDWKILCQFHEKQSSVVCEMWKQSVLKTDSVVVCLVVGGVFILLSSCLVGQHITEVQVKMCRKVFISFRIFICVFFLSKSPSAMNKDIRRSLQNSLPVEGKCDENYQH
jgi:hypothetical protein